MKRFLLPLTFAGTPALAASGPFFSLANTDFVVTIAFLIFIGILLYLKVPSKIGEMLDRRAAAIQKDLDEARALREEAQSILAEYERKQKDVAEQARKIVESAREEAELSAKQAKDELARSIERRMAAAEAQIASAEAAAVREVRDTAISVAVQAAAEVISKGMSADEANKLIDQAIEDVPRKLH